MTDDLPPMLSLIQTLCRLHLQHPWELYQELRGKAQRRAIRTVYKAQRQASAILVTSWQGWLQQTLSSTLRSIYPPPGANANISENCWYCPNVTVHERQVKICCILQMISTTTSPISIPTQLFFCAVIMMVTLMAEANEHSCTSPWCPLLA